MSDDTTWAEFDDINGRWVGTCPRCGTDHGGYWEPNSTGGQLACIDALISQMTGIAGWLLRRRMRRIRAQMHQRRMDAIRRYFEEDR